MAETIGPALTPEGWKLAGHWSRTSLVLGRYVPDSGMGMRENIGGFEVRVNAEGAPTCTGPRAIAKFTDADAHAVAALALYGQPFGFTREDLRALEALYRMSCPCGAVDMDDLAQWGDAQARVPGVIARIAALLPPETP